MKDIEMRMTARTNFEHKKNSYREKWSLLFELANLGDLDKQLSKKVLSDPTHNITKLLLYIYSMECFIYTDLNKACRDQDQSKIQYYGAYAAALSYILYFANPRTQYSKVHSKNTVLYRGLRLTK